MPYTLIKSEHVPDELKKAFRPNHRPVFMNENIPIIKKYKGYFKHISYEHYQRKIRDINTISLDEE